MTQFKLSIYDVNGNDIEYFLKNIQAKSQFGFYQVSESDQYIEGILSDKGTDVGSGSTEYYIFPVENGSVTVTTPHPNPNVNPTGVNVAWNLAGAPFGLTNPIAIGIDAGKTNQALGAVAIGKSAAQINQNTNSIAIGNNAGQTNQNVFAIAIGDSAGASYQATGCIAIGQFAGNNSQAQYSVALGYNAAQNNQLSNSVAIGNQAGQLSQGSQAVAIGYLSGNQSQNIQTVAIGNQAAQNNQSNYSVAVGSFAGQISQGAQTVAIGYGSGNLNQNQFSIAVGSAAGQFTQGYGSIAIGHAAGQSNQGNNSIAIGLLSGQVGQAANSIALNASGNNLPAQNSGFFVNPVRNYHPSTPGVVIPTNWAQTPLSINEYSYEIFRVSLGPKYAQIKLQGMGNSNGSDVGTIYWLYNQNSFNGIHIVQAPGSGYFHYIQRYTMTRTGKALGGNFTTHCYVGNNQGDKGQAVSGDSFVWTNNNNWTAATSFNGSNHNSNPTQMENKPLWFGHLAVSDGPSGGDSTTTVYLVVEYITFPIS